ncbi:MAG: DUF2961 domain-containing protein, partial [Chitinivibrionales bacterium]|nr:DUF2961 domain-containing protein [Chitinivibrionales bacterium]
PKTDDPSLSPQSTSPSPTEPPVIPVGYDAYRMWDRWPALRIGVRAYMRSTHDRTGGNRSACGSHYYYQEDDQKSVMTHTEGRGVLYFVRTNCWHGSPWHYELDGHDHLLRETATEDPVRWLKEHRWAEGAPQTRFEPHELFPAPLCHTWTTTRGADLNWRPLPFEHSLRLAWGRTRYGTGYCIYHKLLPDAVTSRDLKEDDWETPPPADVLELLKDAGPGLERTVDGLDTDEHAGTTALPIGETVDIAHVDRAPATVRLLRLSVPREQAVRFGAVRLQVFWDSRPHASIDAPVSLFYGAGHLYNGEDREYLVRGLPMTIRYTPTRCELSCCFPMPFFSSARFRLVNGAGWRFDDIAWDIRTLPYSGPTNHVAYFHASYRDHAEPQPGRDLVLLDTRDMEGSRHWCGHFVGTSLIFTKRSVLNTLEGIPRFFFDDARSPHGHGTGTEEWGGGGDYWGGRQMTLPLAGHPTGTKRSTDDPSIPEWQRRPGPALNEVHSLYRFLLADLMPFGRNARIQLEHGGENESTEQYETVTFWYGLPGESLILTDTLDIGDTESETAHHYHSPAASQPTEVVSRFEVGVDHIDHDPSRAEVVPAHSDIERHTQGTSTFAVRLEPRNLGVMLRRTLDYRFPNQRAEVYVAGPDDNDPWQHAGTWFTPGSNTCVHSNPAGEADPWQHEAVTCNRRFKESEFLIARRLTEGRKELRVKVEHVPDNRELYPGQPYPEESAWSEIRYDCYCWVMPGAVQC